VSNSALASGLLDSSRSGAVGKGAAGVRLSGHAASPSSSPSQVGMIRPSSSNWMTPQLFAPRTAGVDVKLPLQIAAADVALGTEQMSAS